MGLGLGIGLGSNPNPNPNQAAEAELERLNAEVQQFLAEQAAGREQVVAVALNTTLTLTLINP